MKIIHKGTLRWWTGRQAVCGYCRSALELEESDEVIELGSGESATGHFQCSVCGHKVTIKKYLPAIGQRPS